MKKKNMIIIGIVVVGVIISVYMLTGSKELGNMNHRYSTQTTITSDISFSGEAGDRIKFSFRSNVESGDLNILLYDSKGNDVYKLDKAKGLETYYNLNNSDTYTLVAECNNFIGEYSIKVYKAN